MPNFFDRYDAKPKGVGKANFFDRFDGGVDERPTSQSLGFMKGIARPLENFERINPMNLLDTKAGKAHRAEVREGMHDYFAKREETQKPGMAGQVAGNILGTIPVAAVTRNPLVAGGVQGALLSEGKTPGAVALDAGLGAGLGWAGGKVVEGVADLIKPVIDPAVRRLKEAGVSLTPGMVKGGKAMVAEDKRMSRPVVGDVIAADRQKTQATFVRAGIDKALAPLGFTVPKSVQPGHDAISYAKVRIGQAYDAVIPKLSVKIDAPTFVQKIAPLASTLEGPQRKQLQVIIGAKLKSGQLAGQELKKAQGEIRRLAGVYSRDQSAASNELGRVLHAVDDELTTAMMTQNPQYAPALQKVNEAYRGYRIVADAASRADDGLYNTGQLRTAARRGDFSKNKDATARGDAFMQGFSKDARRVIPARTPDSGTAGRQQARSPLAHIGGAIDAASYRANALMTDLRLIPRPAGARQAARNVRRLRGPVATAVVAAGKPRD